MTLRSLMVSDAAHLAEIQNAAFGSAWTVADLTAMIDDASGFGFIATVGHVATAFVLCRRLGEEAEVLVLATRPEARRQGLGARLLASAAARAGERAQALLLEVAADNAPALSLYLKAGFVLVGRRKEYYSRPGGAEDALVLRLDLNSPEARAYARAREYGLEPPVGSS
jgi:ribosomal-protein-alanine N-acetyltransferase